MLFKYSAKEYKDGIYMIGDGTINSFLFVGDDKALLLDTGWGYSNIKKTVDKVTDKPITLINSHFHPDHSNNNYRFDGAECLIGEADLPTFTKDDVYFNLVYTVRDAIYKKYPFLRIVNPIVDKLLVTKQGNVKYTALKDGDTIDVGKHHLIVKNFPGHTPGEITLLYPQDKFIFMGDACDVGIFFFTNPDYSTHEYAEYCRKYYKEVKKAGYKKYRGAHMPFEHKLGYIKAYADYMDNLKPEDAFIRLNIPGCPSQFCIAFKPSLKHLVFGSFYFAHQCERK